MLYQCEFERTSVSRRVVVRMDSKAIIASRLADDSAASLTIDDNGKIIFSQLPAASVSQTAYAEVDKITPQTFDSVAALVKTFLDP